MIVLHTTQTASVDHKKKREGLDGAGRAGEVKGNDSDSMASALVQVGVQQMESGILDSETSVCCC